MRLATFAAALGVLSLASTSYAAETLVNFSYLTGTLPAATGSFTYSAGKTGVMDFWRSEQLQSFNQPQLS